jgi:hypothetical protein
MTTMTAAQVRSKLLGTWRLVSWYQVQENGTVDYPLGPDAVGQLMYDESGHVSAQLAGMDQPAFASDDWQDARPEEMGAAWPCYFGYFGTFTIDADEAAVTHHIEGSWFPNLVGTRQVRRYRFEDKRLVLDASTPWGEVRIIWEKLPSP